MAYKDILVVPARTDDTAAPYAISMAGIFDAHLTALAIVGEPDWPSPMMAEAPYGIIVEATAELRRDAKLRLEKVTEAARREGVRLTSEIIDVNGAPAAEALGRFSRAFDVTVLSQPDPEGTENRRQWIEAALFDSGRSVLVVPYIQSQPARFDRIVVAWDESAVAAHAVGEAMPLLKRANRVEVVRLMPIAKPGKEQVAKVEGIEMAEHLARHGIKAEFMPIHCDAPFADMLMSHAYDWNADLIVMGGYGHSALRESLFGGFTRGVLDTMTIPTLIAH